MSAQIIKALRIRADILERDAEIYLTAESYLEARQSARREHWAPAEEMRFLAEEFRALAEAAETLE